MNELCQECGYERELHTPKSHAFVTAFMREIEELEETTSLERELASVLNKHSAENGSNTPDFILAEYLISCLKAYNVATKSCRAWQGVDYLNVGTKDT